MTPLAIRHTLSAFATAALVFAAASGAVADQAGKGTGVKVDNPQGDRYEEFSAANADNALPMALVVRLQRRLQVDL